MSLSVQPQRFGCNVTFHLITVVYTKSNNLWPADTQRKEQGEADLDNLISHSFLVIGNIAENVVLIIVLMKTENPDRHLTNSGTLYITFVLTTKYPAGCNIISLFLEHPPGLSCIINVYFGRRSVYSWFFSIFTFSKMLQRSESVSSLCACAPRGELVPVQGQQGEAEQSTSASWARRVEASSKSRCGKQHQTTSCPYVLNCHPPPLHGLLVLSWGTDTQLPKAGAEEGFLWSHFCDWKGLCFQNSPTRKRCSLPEPKAIKAGSLPSNTSTPSSSAALTLDSSRASHCTCMQWCYTECWFSLSKCSLESRLNQLSSGFLVT